MKKKLNILTINFDTKVKVLIAICVTVAVIIISYSFWYICINNNENTAKLPVEKIQDIDSILDISQYEAEYEITVISNKTKNTYGIKESVDLNNGSFTMVINDNLTINVTNSNTKIVKKNMEYEYNVINSGDILKNNPVSFYTIIDCVKKIRNKEIEGSIKRIEQNNVFLYKINIPKDYIEGICRIDVTLSKEKCKISEINMYNEQDTAIYTIVIKSFLVKN